MINLIVGVVMIIMIVGLLGFIITDLLEAVGVLYTSLIMVATIPFVIIYHKLRHRKDAKKGESA